MPHAEIKEIEVNKINLLWTIVPSLGALAAAGALIYQWVNALPITWPVAIAGIVALFAVAEIYTIEEMPEKEDRVSLLKSDFDYYVYQLAKAIAYLTGVAAICAIIAGVIAWLGSVTIAPMTVVIVLLAMILFKLNTLKR